MAKDTISILDGSTFLVSDLRGDIEASPDQPTGSVNENPTVSVIRKRSIGDGFHEDVTVINHGADPLEFELRLDAGADFADLFEVKDALAKKGENSARIEGDTLVLAYERSLIDLAALRFETTLFPGQPMPAAGLPWFMTVFGRDSLLTSFQALPFTPELAQTTLRVLARYQAEKLDDFRDAEPGKILHEIRFGELTHFGERPHSPYYGTADATPLFLILLDEVERWTGTTGPGGGPAPPAPAALGWIAPGGARAGDVSVESARRNKETGLEN